MMKKTESPKLTSKVQYELLIRSIEQSFFSKTQNLIIDKNTSVNHVKTKDYEKLIPMKDQNNTTFSSK